MVSTKTEWFTPGQEKTMGGHRIKYVTGNVSNVTIHLYPSWGGVKIASIPLIGAHKVFKNPANVYEYVSIGYKDFWDANSGFAVELFIRWESSQAPTEPTYSKGRIDGFSTSVSLASIGKQIKTITSLANIGETGNVKYKIGIGYIDNSNEIILTGQVVEGTENITSMYKRTIDKTVTVQQSDYNAQEGVGWAYKPKEMKIFVLAGHSEAGNLVWDDDSRVNFIIAAPYIPPPPLDPKPPEGIITSKTIDRNLVNIDTAYTYSFTVKNIGDTGKINTRVGIGYIDDSNEIIFTGSPVSESFDINGGSSRVISDTVNIKMTDYYAQQGTGWAYSPKQIKIFFITDHDTVNLNIRIKVPPDYEDPTDPGDWFPPDEPDKPDEPDEPENLGVGFGFGKVTFKMPSILKEIIKRVI